MHDRLKGRETQKYNKICVLFLLSLNRSAIMSLTRHLLSRGYTGDFSLVLFSNRQQNSKIFRVATLEHAIRQSGKIVKVDRDNFK